MIILNMDGTLFWAETGIYCTFFLFFSLYNKVEMKIAKQGKHPK